MSRAAVNEFDTFTQTLDLSMLNVSDHLVIALLSPFLDLIDVNGGVNGHFVGYCRPFDVGNGLFEAFFAHLAIP